MTTELVWAVMIAAYFMGLITLIIRDPSNLNPTKE